jgi:hypothetical protein
MHREYLGDALDHWKGGLFELLQSEGVLHNFNVDAMASDGHWDDDEIDLYARLLRVNRQQFVRHCFDLVKDRAKYFSEIPKKGDIFFDPDRGILADAYPRFRHLTPTELFEIMNGEPARIVAVYQHKWQRKTMATTMEQVLAALESRNMPFACSWYSSGTVAMLFISQTRDRVKSVRDCFCQLLGQRANRRVGFRASPSGS